MKHVVFAHGDYQVIRIEEEIVLTTNISELKRTVNKIVDTGHTTIAISFSQSSHLNSEAIGILVACLQIIEKHRGTLGLVRPTTEMLEVFQIVGLLDMVELYRSEDQVGTDRCPIYDSCSLFAAGSRLTDEQRCDIRRNYCDVRARRCAHWLPAATGKEPPPGLKPDALDDAMQGLGIY